MGEFIAGIIAAIVAALGVILTVRSRRAENKLVDLSEAQRKLDEARRLKDKQAEMRAKAERNKIIEELKNANRHDIVNRFWDAMSKRPGTRE